MTDTDYAEWFLQGIQGVGPTLARSIVDDLGVPLKLWHHGEDRPLTRKDLTGVRGLGKVMAERMERLFAQVEE